MIAILVCLLFGHRAPTQDVLLLAMTTPFKRTKCRRCSRLIYLKRRPRDGRIVVKQSRGSR